MWKSGCEVEFRVKGALHAWHHRRRYLTGLAWDLIAAGALLGPERPRSVLMLGLAGGTALRVLRKVLPECRFTAVDIDAGIVALARRHMALDRSGAEVVIGDAYAWLARNRRVFDVVIDDIYLAGRDDVYRPGAVDSGVLSLFRKAVAPGGVLVVNVLTGAGHRGVQSRMRKLLVREFPVVKSVRSEEAMNEILVAGESVAGGARLAPHGGAFADPEDRAYWERLRVRLLGGAARSRL